MNNVSALPVVASEAPALVNLSAASLMLDVTRMEHIVRMGELMAASRTTIPGHLQGKPADCAAIITQSMVWGLNPWAVAQKTHVTQSGALGYEAQLINSVIITNAPIVARPEYEFIGDWSKILGKVEERKSDKGGKYYVAAWDRRDEEGLGVIVSCQLRGEDHPRTITVMMSQAWPRFSTQWATDPQQQITYLAIRKWSRRYTPDVILGVNTGDELEEANVIDVGSGSTQDAERPSTGDRLKEAAKSAAAKATKTDADQVDVEPKRPAKPATKPGAPTPDEIIKAINAAKTPDALTAAIDLARGMEDGPEKDKIRAAYHEKLAAEKAKAAAAPPPAAASNDDPGDGFNAE